ncbi:MAG: putative membrane protein [Granulosicoccus sp.]|jgi:putative membrane protein
MRGNLRTLTGFILMSVAVPTLSQQQETYVHGHMWSSGGWFLGPISMLLSLAVIIAIVVLFNKHVGASIQGVKTTHMHQKETPLEMLNMRYARGDIDHEEYELRRKTLES